MARYAWIIDSGPEFDRVSPIMGPRGISDPHMAQLAAGDGRAFHLYCDDDLIYSGRIVGDYDGFEPLDDFGTPDYGCNEIRYRANWETDSGSFVAI